MDLSQAQSILPELAGIDFDRLSPERRAELEPLLADLYLDRCRNDGSLFNEFVLKDDRGEHIRQGRVHRTWHRLVEEHQNVIIWSHVECGKTQQIAVGRVLYEIQKNPNQNIAIIQSASTEASKTILSIAQYIEQDPDFRTLAPHIFPDKSKKWNSTQLFVKRQSMSRDPSIQGIGVNSPILGARLDIAILDDVLNGKNTLTETERKNVIKWFMDTIVGRMNPETGRIIMIGNAWHPQDLMHHVAKNDESWFPTRFPVIDDEGNIPWPEKWSPEAIEKRKTLLKDDPSAFARSMLCKARDDSDSRFKQEWVDMCSRAGRGLKFCHSIAEVPHHLRVRGRPITGVDFGIKKTRKSGKTVLFTGLHMQDGKKLLLNIQAGRWGGKDILDRLDKVHRDFGSILVVEDNQAQHWMGEFASYKQVPTIPFNTGSNKKHPEYGVESIATELSKGEWIIPCDDAANGKFSYHPEISEWIQQMLYYDPNVHTGDHLMASWFFREGIYVARIRARRVTTSINRR